MDCIDKYNSGTSALRKFQSDKAKQLLLSNAPPPKPVTSGTVVARYIKTFCRLTVIGVTVFTAHSNRSDQPAKQ